MSVSKSIKKAQLYPLKRKDQDEDDIQDIKADQKKPRTVPKSVAKQAQHILPGARFEDSGGGKDKGGDKKDEPPGDSKPAKRKRAEEEREDKAEAEANDPRSKRSRGYARYSAHGDRIQPPPVTKPWDDLMKELTSYYTKSGPDYEVFPFPILKCSDYSWLVMGKRRTGKTTL